MSQTWSKTILKLVFIFTKGSQFFAFFEPLDTSQIVMLVASHLETIHTCFFSSLNHVAFKFLLFVLPQIAD